MTPYLLIGFVFLFNIAACENTNKGILELTSDRITELSETTPLREIIRDRSFRFACILRPYSETRIAMGTFIYPKDFDVGNLEQFLPVTDDKFIIAIFSENRSLANSYRRLGNIDAKDLGEYPADTFVTRVDCGEIDKLIIVKENSARKVKVDLVKRL